MRGGGGGDLCLRSARSGQRGVAAAALPDRGRRGRGHRRLRGRRLRARGRPRPADRLLHDSWRLHLRLRAGPASADHRPYWRRGARGTAHTRGTARSRLHLPGELLRHLKAPDGRPERADDPGQPAAPRVVPSCAHRCRSRQPEPSDLPGQAGSRLVAGPDHQHRRHGVGRGRDRRPALPADRDAQGHRGVGGDAPRAWSSVARTPGSPPTRTSR